MTTDELKEMVAKDKARLAEMANGLREAGYRFAGMRVHFTHIPRCTRKGRQLTKYCAVDAATKAAMIIASSISKKVDIIVAPDGVELSLKAQQAVDRGVKLMREHEFWHEVGVEIDPPVSDRVA